MERTTITLSLEKARPPHRTMKRRSGGYLWAPRRLTARKIAAAMKRMLAAMASFAANGIEYFVLVMSCDLSNEDSDVLAAVSSCSWADSDFSFSDRERWSP